MKVVRSKTLGYCHGVAATLKKAEECIERGKRENKSFYCIGELIHNKDVVSYFEKRGLKVIKEPNVKPGIALIRAHGISDCLRKEFLDAGFELVDATCINIKCSKDAIKKASALGREVIVIGVRNHAETECLIGSENINCRLVTCFEELKDLYVKISADKAVTVITQTTFIQSEYIKIVEDLKRHFSNIVFANKLCPECTKRKENVLELSACCNAIVVIGGKKSENTKDLAKYAEKTGMKVFFLENKDDLNEAVKQELKLYKTIGICSGTSTPLKIINSVFEEISKL